jgi:glycosyltransferase involved in cell wall biosynthesis
VGTQVSVVMPAYNERPNLAELVPQTLRVLRDAGMPCEVIVVDDGSTDGTPQLMEQLATPELVALRLRRNAGKSAALSVGLARARGEYIVLMDADGQDDPDEIPRLLAVLEGRDPDVAAGAIAAGAIGGGSVGRGAIGGDAVADAAVDMVTGRRAERNDRFVKRATSRLYNRVTSLVTGVRGRDFNSGLKVMRREVALSLDLYGELHRYLPVLAQWRGFRVHEVDVRHHSRRHGASKFGRARFWRGFLDLMTVKFLTTYTARPFHLFGGLGLLMGLAGSGLLIWMLVSWFMGEAVGTRPALLTGVLLVVVAVQMTFFGLLAELIVHLRRQRDLDAAIEVDEL